MTYEELRTFITEKMQMQAVYQPVMLMELLKNGGTADESVIAQAILDLDPTQIAHYKDRVRNMVGQVLRKHGVTTRSKSTHRLSAYENLSAEQVSSLIQLLQEKLDFELLSRGEQFWKHRATEREQIGSIRYRVLERALGRCECCGVGKEDRPLDVDHIVPRSKKGKNDISNYQALCWLCNTNKGNRSAFDFRGLDTKYEHREQGCLFCDIQSDDRKRIIAENTLAYVIRDGFPVTEGHTLFMPKRHVKDYFGLTQAEINAINSLMQEQKEQLQKSDTTIEGFNIGMNCGEIAGQSVFHCHVHLIPRRKGDVENPRGGVRNTIPGKGDY